MRTLADINRANKRAWTHDAERSLMVLSYQGKEEVTKKLQAQGVSFNTKNLGNGGYEFTWSGGPSVEEIRK